MNLINISDMKKLSSIEDLCIALMRAQTSLEGEFSGNWEQSNQDLRDLRDHLRETYQVNLKEFDYLDSR
jgi:hypothetical protein